MKQRKFLEVLGVVASWPTGIVDWGQVSVDIHSANKKKARKTFRAFIISNEGRLSSPYHPYRPCHHQASPETRFLSSAVRRPSPLW